VTEGFQTQHRPVRDRLPRVVAVVLVAGFSIAQLWPSSAPARVYGPTSMSAPAAVSVSTAGGIKYVTKSGMQIGANEIKTFKAQCPNGTHVLGGGFYQGRGVIDPVIGAHSFPYDGGDRGGAFDDGWAAKLQSSNSSAPVNIYAMCASISAAYRQSPPTLLFGEAPEVLMRLCPADTYISGAGTSGSTDFFELTSQANTARSYYAKLYNTGSDDLLTLRAICIKRKVKYPNSDEFIAENEAQSSGITRCPSDFPHVVGGGIDTVSALPEDIGNMSIASMTPIYHDVGLRDGWKAWVDNRATTDGSFFVYPNCIKPL
jgi:hypothetical protein